MKGWKRIISLHQTQCNPISHTGGLHCMECGEGLLCPIMSHLVACLQNSVADCADSQCLGFLPEFDNNEIIKTWRVDSEQIALFCAAFALRGCLEVWRKPSWIRIYARNPGRIFQHRIVSNGGRVRVPWGQPIGRTLVAQCYMCLGVTIR